MITGINPSRKRFAEDKEFAYTFRGVTVEEKRRRGKITSSYWGRNEDATWMGYDMERISDAIELYQIRGFKDRPDRLNPDLKDSALSGSLILFYGMYDERSKDKLLTENDFNQLYEKAKKMKQEWKG